MAPQLKTYKRFFLTTRQYLRRHWQQALRVREKLSLSEESLHLLMAAVVGVMGGIINVLFYLSVEKVQVLIVGSDKNIVEVAESMWPFWRLITPAMGGLAAGAVLFWGLRFWPANRVRRPNILEVVVAGDGRLPLRSGLVRCRVVADEHWQRGIHRARRRRRNHPIIRDGGF